MRLSQVPLNRLVACVVLLAVVLLSPLALASAIPGRAEVRAIKGTATYSTNGGPSKTLRVGMILRSGTTIKTGSNSSVDLFLGISAGVVRLVDNSTISFDKLTLRETGADTAVEVQIHLPDGELYFNVNKLSEASRYEIKMPSGVAGIRGTKGCFSSKQIGDLKPPVVVLTGTVSFAHVAPNGEVTLHKLNAPPPVFFSPGEGVKEAPADLISIVTKEVDAVSASGSKGAPPPPNKPIEPFVSPNSGA